jgi:hypothetical protein
MPKVTKYVALHSKDGETVQLSPGDDLPDWADKDSLNPALFEDEDSGLDEDGSPSRVAGPGMATPADETDDEAAERKAAEAKRKREQRAAKKAADEEAQRLADEREQQEHEAAEKAAADEAAAAQNQNPPS